jgi:hypothetical protein
VINLFAVLTDGALGGGGFLGAITDGLLLAPVEDIRKTSWARLAAQTAGNLRVPDVAYEWSNDRTFYDSGGA